MESERITSRQNQRVKDAVRLRTRRGRDAEGKFLIDGGREIVRAVGQQIGCLTAFICRELATTDDSRQAIAMLGSSGTELVEVAPDVYAKLRFGERDDGVVVVAETPRRKLRDLELPAVPLVAVAEQVEKPGNLGAIVRSADAAGLDAVVVADGVTDLFNANVVRASLGTVFGRHVVDATGADAIDWLHEHGLKVVAAFPDAETCYTEVDFREPTAIVLGSEADGLSAAWHRADVTGVRLPMRGIADSLNVSTAAAVLFYEALRQRTAAC